MNFKINLFTVLITCLMANYLNTQGAGLTDNTGHFFIAPGWNDNNPGTPNSPFKTISKAGTLVSPGDTILLRGGSICLLMLPI